MVFSRPLIAALTIVSVQTLTYGQSRFVMPLIMDAPRDPYKERTEAIERAIAANDSVLEMHRQDREEAQRQREAEVAATLQHNKQIAYEQTAIGLSQINPDSPSAEADVYAWRAFAGKHLDTETMRELFGPIDRALNVTRETLAEIYRETGVSQIVNEETGLIDWNAIQRAAEGAIRNQTNGTTESSGERCQFCYSKLLAASGADGGVRAKCSGCGREFTQ